MPASRTVTVGDRVEALTVGFGTTISDWTGDIEVLASLVERHHLVVLRQVGWSEPAQLEVTRALGPIVARRPGRFRRGVPNVRVELGADRYSDRWHADLSWSSTDAISVLSCSRHEADAEPTSFADTSTLFDRLERLPAVASLIDSMQDRVVRHDLDNSRRLRPATTPASSVAHRTQHRLDGPLLALDASPMIVPKQGGPQGTPHRLVDVGSDGRRFLRIGDHAWSIDGLSAEDTSGVLRRLTEAATDPDFVYLHRWIAGDAVVYDNRMMLHRRSGVAGTDPRRRLVRTMAARAQPTSDGVTQL